MIMRISGNALPIKSECMIGTYFISLHVKVGV